MPFASTTMVPALEDAVLRSTAAAAVGPDVGAAEVAAGLDAAGLVSPAVVLVVPGLPAAACQGGHQRHCGKTGA